MYEVSFQSISLIDAFKDTSGDGLESCPLCLLRKNEEANYIKSVFSEYIRDDHFKLKLLDTKFCNQHFEMFLNYKDKLGVAILFRYLSDFIVEDIENVNTNGKKFILSKSSPNTQFINTMEKKTCLVCDHLDERDQKNIGEIFKLYNTSVDFKTLYFNSHGFCFNHLLEVIKFFDKKPSKASNEFLSKTMDIEKRELQKLRKDLSSFVNSFDYRNIDLEITAEQKNSVKRAAHLLGGLFLEKKQEGNY